MSRNHISLKELNGRIKTILGANLDTYWLIAEISELKVNYSGHCYLEFIQKNEKTERIEARARAVIWANVFRMVQPYFETTTGQSFSEGIKVMVRVVVEFHEVYGLSLNVVDIEPTYTVGEVALRKQKIIEKLQKEGVLEMNKELELPYLLNRIAIISSKTAAGLQDFQDQLQNNPSGLRFYTKLFPAVMQGNEAENSIIDQMDRIFQVAEHFDAVVIIRGGGAQADLDCFNNYWLAYHVTQFPLPVLTGIGHEQDDSVVDMVANTRLKTPTAVAEFLVDHMSIAEDELLSVEEAILTKSREVIGDKKAELKDSAYLLKSMVHDKILNENKNMSRLSSTYISSVKTVLYRKSQYLGKMSFSFGEKSRVLLSRQESKLGLVIQKLKSEVGKGLSGQKHFLDIAEKSVELNNPGEVLRKGYSITLKDGKSIKDGELLKHGDEIETIFYKGNTKSTVKK